MESTQKRTPLKQADLQDLIILSHKFPVILYDGVCHLCHNSVSWIVQKDTQLIFKYMPLQWVTGLQDMNSVILLSEGRIYSQSEATVQILKILGGPYKYLSAALNVIPSAVSNAVYRFIASRRYRWFGKYDACEMVDDTYYDWWNHRTE